MSTADRDHALAEAGVRSGGPGRVRLDQNESPHEMSPAAMAAAMAALDAGTRYPAPDSSDLCRALAGHHEIDPAMVAVGAGSAELLMSACRAWAGRERPVVTTRPGFPGYAMMAAIAAAPVREVACAGCRIDPAAVAAALPGAGCAFVCNPLNPTGSVLSADELRTLVAAGAGWDGVLVVDEAYAEFAGGDHRSGIDHVRAGGSLVVTRTFSKAYGLAGLRVGYAVGPPDLVATLARSRLPFTVNGVAQAAAAAALGDQAHLRDVVGRVARGRRRLEEGAALLGYGVLAGRANFVVLAAPRGEAALASGLAERSFLVQPLTPFGLPGHVRITVGTEDENAALLRALEEVA